MISGLIVVFEARKKESGEQEGDWGGDRGARGHMTGKGGIREK
jgi:hypothetical protein